VLTASVAGAGTGGDWEDQREPAGGYGGGGDGGTYSVETPYPGSGTAGGGGGGATTVSLAGNIVIIAGGGGGRAGSFADNESGRGGDGGLAGLPAGTALQPGAGQGASREVQAARAVQAGCPSARETSPACRGETPPAGRVGPAPAASKIRAWAPAGAAAVARTAVAPVAHRQPVRSTAVAAAAPARPGRCDVHHGRAHRKRPGEHRLHARRRMPTQATQAEAAQAADLPDGRHRGPGRLPPYRPDVTSAPGRWPNTPAPWTALSSRSAGEECHPADRSDPRHHPRADARGPTGSARAGAHGERRRTTGDRGRSDAASRTLPHGKRQTCRGERRRRSTTDPGGRPDDNRGTPDPSACSLQDR
jgi:hypothetical protein